MSRSCVLPAASALVLCATPALAHDAFGDLGPFYASLLHPLADPLQGALLVGTSAYFAGRALTDVRWSLPIFIGAATTAAIVNTAGAEDTGSWIAVPPLLVALIALFIGLAALLPERWTPRAASLWGAASAGVLIGLAPGGAPGDRLLQTLFGTCVGIALLTLLVWFALESASRSLTPLVPKVAGAWVVAVGLLIVAFSV